jgi:hypothetical protein
MRLTNFAPQRTAVDRYRGEIDIFLEIGRGYRRRRKRRLIGGVGNFRRRRRGVAASSRRAIAREMRRGFPAGLFF